MQGLRALAVIAVIFDHVLHWPAGGFVGVDIFFVISGFLITGILLREHERTGRISLRSFYGSRLRRLLPSAAVVLVATGAIGSVLFNQTRALSTLWDAGASFLFVANWRFTALGTDYFSALAPASAVQHYWSLSVEEQFYLVWPWLMIVILLVGARGSRTPGRGRRAVGILAIVVVAASFAYAVWDSATNPAVAYFSTFSRAWELGVGAILAVAAPLAARMPVAWRVILGWAGLAGVVASFIVVTGDIAFPGPGAALPVLATALVLAAGMGGPQRTLVPLTNPVSVYLGNISYSLYLWHFPIFVFLTMLLPEQSPQSTLIILGTILAVSVTSYYLIEQPFHRSPWLRGRHPAGERRAARRSWRESFGSQFILSSMGVFVIAIVVAVSFQPAGGRATSEAPSVAGADSAVNPEVGLQAELAAAAAATAWPDKLSPSLDDAMARTSNDNPARDCFDIGDTPDFGGCTWGADSAPNHMYLVGDSEALSYAPAFKAIAEDSDGQWKITTIGLYGCRFTEVLVANEGTGVMDACPQRKLDISDRIVADAPQLVVVANAFAEGQDANRSPLSVESLVASTLAETAGYNAAGKIVYLAPPPLGAELGRCYSAVSSPQDCTVGVGSVWQQFAAALAAPSATGDHFVSSLPFSCSAGICPAFAGTLPTKYDTVHLTPEYAVHVAPAIRDALTALGVL
ncbi:hypothetical protein C3B59_12450 [Cryobacterium zongtaii]|uniref:Acyltransferase n=1 Tax=Cryobacterium zongtaii TaxID=1259217 RepID=A0A2S3Z8V6_9MICO|nr:hypothetical protein C3B59_12450 [Cryobacterium zongtaii]